MHESNPVPINSIIIADTGGLLLARLLAWAALPVLLLATLVSSPSSSRTTAGELCELGLVARLLLHSCDDGPIVTTPTIMEHSHSRSRAHSTRHPDYLFGPSALPASYGGNKSLYVFSSSEPVPSQFSLDMSTQENYGVENKEFYGPYKDIRAELDYDYHGNYSRRRQEFQDKIVQRLLDGTTIHDTQNGRVCKVPAEPWIVFTAGVMGAGKSHTMKQLDSRGLFPLASYVIVDPDEIRSHFPEYHIYARQNQARAGELTHREAGYVTEIVTAAAMRSGHNVLVDGSLRDYEWYLEYFRTLRERYANLRIAILHVVAPREAIFERAANRAKKTGREIPRDTLEASLQQVPLSVEKLAPSVDFFCELDNSTPGDATLTTEGMTWDDFRDNWAQTCPWVPSMRGGLKGKA